MVVDQRHTNWKAFTRKERLVTENTVLLVGLLYSMCKVELVLQSEKTGWDQYNQQECNRAFDQQGKNNPEKQFSEKTLH